jgi:hypothetical protein
MVFLYVEVYVLVLLSFLAGCGAATGAVRLLFRRRTERLSAYRSEGSR